MSNTNLPVPVAPVEVTPSTVTCPEKLAVAAVSVPVKVGLALNTKLPVPVAPVDVTPSTVICPVELILNN